MGRKRDVNPNTPRWDKRLEHEGLLRYQTEGLSNEEIQDRWDRAAAHEPGLRNTRPDWASYGRTPGGGADVAPRPSGENWPKQLPPQGVRSPVVPTGPTIASAARVPVTIGTIQPSNDIDDYGRPVDPFWSWLPGNVPTYSTSARVKRYGSFASWFQHLSELGNP